MIQGALVFQFIINQKETGEIEPVFKPIKLMFKEEKFKENNYSELIVEKDIFAIYYQHTTGILKSQGKYSSFFETKLMETSYQVASYYCAESGGSQYLTLFIFEVEDDIEVFFDVIKSSATVMDYLLDSLEKATVTKQLSLTPNIIKKLEENLTITLYQIDRLCRLDKLQKAALIFNSDDRLRILELLRQRPISRNELKLMLEVKKENLNIDALIEPFIELNIVRRDWAEGERDKMTGRIKHQGEHLFLTKDIILTRMPNIKLLNHLKEIKSEFHEMFNQKLVEFFSNYNPNAQPLEETKKLASLLLKPNIYDIFVLMRNKFFPIDKIPEELSKINKIEQILEALKDLNIITEVKDEKKRKWMFLMSDIKPLIFFPEYLLPKIWEAYHTKDQNKKITYEIAKKANDLLELSYDEKIEF